MAMRRSRTCVCYCGAIHVQYMNGTVYRGRHERSIEDDDDDRRGGASPMTSMNMTSRVLQSKSPSDLILSFIELIRLQSCACVAAT